MPGAASRLTTNTRPATRIGSARPAVRAATTGMPAPASNAKPGRTGTTYRFGWYEMEATPTRPKTTHRRPTSATRVGPDIGGEPSVKPPAGSATARSEVAGRRDLSARSTTTI